MYLIIRSGNGHETEVVAKRATKEAAYRLVADYRVNYPEYCWQIRLRDRSVEGLWNVLRKELREDDDRAVETAADLARKLSELDFRPEFVMLATVKAVLEGADEKALLAFIKKSLQNPT